MDKDLFQDIANRLAAIAVTERMPSEPVGRQIARISALFRRELEAQYRTTSEQLLSNPLNLEDLLRWVRLSVVVRREIDDEASMASLLALHCVWMPLDAARQRWCLESGELLDAPGFSHQALQTILLMEHYLGGCQDG